MYKKIDLRTLSRVLIVAVATALALVACAEYKRAPLWIYGDGLQDLACSGFVRITRDEAGINVSYTDSEGIDQVYRGLMRLRTTEVPTMIDAPMPDFPEPPTTLDENGVEKYKIGIIYDWPNGAKARRFNDRWVPVKIPNDICN